MENKLTPELREKAKQAKTPEELAALAKENGIELTPEEANTYFAQLNPKTGELADDELEDVAGGGCGEPGTGHDRLDDLSGYCSNWQCKSCEGWWCHCHCPQILHSCPDCKYFLNENGCYYCTY